MANWTGYVGRYYQDHGSLQRNPKEFLEGTLVKKLQEVKGSLDGWVFGHMQDGDDYRVVCLGPIVLRVPVELDIRTGRHTGLRMDGPKKGSPKAVGPYPTELDDPAAENLLTDVLARNPRLRNREWKSEYDEWIREVESARHLSSGDIARHSGLGGSSGRGASKTIGTNAVEFVRPATAYPEVANAGVEVLPVGSVSPSPNNSTDVVTADQDLLEQATASISAAGPVPMPRGNPVPQKVSVSTVQYARSAQVRAFVYERAKGRCEDCDSPAPFLAAGGRPYLEVHHVHRLSQDGPDTVENAVALCPNCHRAHHLADNSAERQEALYRKIPRLVPPSK